MYDLPNGNLVSPSVPEWTEWYSYPHEEADTQIHSWKDIFNTRSYFNNSYVCPAPIALQARSRITNNIVSPATFDEYTHEHAACYTNDAVF